MTALGCSDSTGPSSVAHHLDAVYRQICAKAYSPASPFVNGGNYDMQSPYWPKCQLMSVLLAGPASGAEPSAVRVTTGHGVETWQGMMIFEYDTSGNGAPYTQQYELIVYSDPDVSTAVVSFFVNSSGTINTGTYVLTSDTVIENGTPLSDSSARVSLGSPCHDISGLSNPLGNQFGFPPIEYGGDVCHLATFMATLNATFPTMAGLDSSLTTISIAPQSINGISVIPGRFYLDRVGYR